MANFGSRARWLLQATSRLDKLSNVPSRCMCIQSNKRESLASRFSKTKQAQDVHKQKHVICRTAETDPGNHTDRHLGLFYTVPDEDFNRWMRPGLRPHFYDQCKAFKESCLMVRQPAVDVIKYLQAANYSSPANRYMLYGDFGCGKTSALHHIIHHCGLQGWLILHVPWGAHWGRFFSEVAMSTHKEGRVDLPIQAAHWLAMFRAANEPLLKELDLRTHKRYTWSKREVADEGTPLLDTIDFALNRAKYASDIMGMVLTEIKEQASTNRFKVLVAVDGANAFWGSTLIEVDNVKYEAGEISLVHNFKKLLKNDWSGGAVVCTVDDNAQSTPDVPSYLPKYLLGKEGFEHFDPHIPVHVPHFSEKEVHSSIDYYLETGWIQNPQGASFMGKKEMIFLSQSNPLELYKVSMSW